MTSALSSFSDFSQWNETWKHKQNQFFPPLSYFWTWSLSPQQYKSIINRIDPMEERICEPQGSMPENAQLKVKKVERNEESS